MPNIGAQLPELTPQECNDIVFALKRFRYEKYETLRYDDKTELIFADLEDVTAALRLWGPAALADKLSK